MAYSSVALKIIHKQNINWSFSAYPILAIYSRMVKSSSSIYYRKNCYWTKTQPTTTVFPLLLGTPFVYDDSNFRKLTTSMGVYTNYWDVCTSNAYLLVQSYKILCLLVVLFKHSFWVYSISIRRVIEILSSTGKIIMYSFQIVPMLPTFIQYLQWHKLSV